jgi:hypothetical protein
MTASGLDTTIVDNPGSGCVADAALQNLQIDFVLKRASI